MGVGTSAKGEVLIYEARLDEAGNVLPRGKDPETGLVDWAVSASTLKGKWGLDVTHDWFEANTPKDPPPAPREDPREGAGRAHGNHGGERHGRRNAGP